MAGCRAVELILTDAERAELQGLAARRSTAQGLALRARIVLACAEGAHNKAVAAKLGVCQPAAGKWQAARRAAGGGPARRAQARRAPDGGGRAGRGAGHGHPERAQGRDAPEFARHGAGGRAVGVHRAAHLARVRPGPAPAGNVQAFDRP